MKKHLKIKWFFFFFT